MTLQQAKQWPLKKATGACKHRPERRVAFGTSYGETQMSASFHSLTEVSAPLLVMIMKNIRGGAHKSSAFHISLFPIYTTTKNILLG
jgi:hypothetical protein